MPAMTKRRRWRKWGILGLIVAVLLACVTIPTPYYVELPGSADRVSQFVKVGGKRDQASGSYRLMSVAIVGPATPAMLLWAQFQPFHAVISKVELMGDGTTQDYDFEAHQEMKGAQNDAMIAAFRAANKPVTRQFKGSIVSSVVPGSKFAGEVKRGDTIMAINDQNYPSTAAMVEAIHHLPAKKKVTLSLRRQGKTKRVSRNLIKIPGTKRWGIGMSLSDYLTVTSTPKVKIDAEDIGGPSGGLIFALQIYSQLTKKSLRRGRVIAGTGTMTADGKVGLIGGVDKKVYAADRAGAAMFLVPAETQVTTDSQGRRVTVNNYADAQAAAKKIKSRMKIVPVASLKDAIVALDK